MSFMDDLDSIPGVVIVSSIGHIARTKRDAWALPTSPPVVPHASISPRSGVLSLDGSGSEEKFTFVSWPKAIMGGAGAVSHPD